MPWHRFERWRETQIANADSIRHVWQDNGISCIEVAAPAYMATISYESYSKIYKIPPPPDTQGTSAFLGNKNVAKS